MEGAFYVAYSRMDTIATARLDKILEEAKPDVLYGLVPDAFTERLANIYAELDYIHPFSDSNSHTL